MTVNVQGVLMATVTIVRSRFHYKQWVTYVARRRHV